jgi:WD40 repeat protein
VSASSWDPLITVWEANTGDVETSVSYGCHLTDIQWLPDDTQIVATANCTGTDVKVHGELLFFEVKSRLGIPTAIEKKTALVCPNTDSVGSPRTGMKWQWSPSRRYIAYDCGSSPYIYVWDSMSKQNILIYKAHSKPIQAMAWSPDSTRIASSSDNTVNVWQVVKFS